MCVVCEARLAPEGALLDFCWCGAPQTFAAYRRLEADLNRREMIGGAAAVLGMFAGFGLAPRAAKGQGAGGPVLFTNLRLFDGETISLREGVDVLVEGGRIAALPPRGQGPAEAERVDCGGRVLMPGLIDAHWHATLVGASLLGALTQEPSLLHLISGREAGATLRRGFTTVRDVAGPSFGLKMAIDRGLVEGPRIFPSGAALSQTAGHGDFRFVNDVPRTATQQLHIVEREGVMMIADGVPEVLRRTREQLMKGASQIKIMAGGGVSSLYDPLDVVQYTEAEMRAAVDSASDWGTYVCAHVYTPAGIQRALRMGVKCIEHGQLADEDSARMMADMGAWWSIQPFLDDEDANPQPDPAKRAKQLQVSAGTERAFGLAERFGVKMAFGTDILFNPAGGAAQGRQLSKFARFMSPLAALRLATGAAGELLALSGERAPYPGRLGVIAEGANADLLVVEGEPETDLSWLDRPQESLKVIMKGGRFVENDL